MKINYIVCCFLGHRRNQILPNSLDYAKAHIDFFRNNEDPNIARITFILNSDVDGEVDALRSYLESAASGSQYILERISIYQRENAGLSYAAWDQEIRRSLDNNEDYDYYFLMEDDYIPSYENFYKPYLDTINNKNVSYACSVINRPEEMGYAPRHASSSIGMLRGKDAKYLNDSIGKVFHVNYGRDYGSGEQNQIYFLNNMSFDSIEDENHHILFYDFRYGLMYYERDSHLEKNPSPITPVLKDQKEWERIIVPFNFG